MTPHFLLSIYPYLSKIASIALTLLILLQIVKTNWLEHIQLNWKKIGKLNIVPAAVNLESLLANHA